MAQAINYLAGIDLDAIMAYEADLLAYATGRLAAIPGVKLIGTAEEKAGVISFVMDNAHAHDIGTILDQEGIAVRTGHHCAMPIMERFAIAATARASLAFYNTKEEIDTLVKGIHKVREVFG
jgi:cysteine desulfurase/selenocysteine lyase